MEQTAFQELQVQRHQHELRLYNSGGSYGNAKGREQTLCVFKVDCLWLYKTKTVTSSTGVSEILSAIVFEFFDCYFHGCPDCYPDDSKINKKRNGVPMRDLYTTTVVDRLERLHVQLQQNTVFFTTDHLSYVLKSVFAYGSASSTNFFCYLWKQKSIIQELSEHPLQRYLQN